jgi:ribosomal protein L40E
MAKFPEADARLFYRKFVCRKCKSVIKTSSSKITEGKIKCRNCGSHVFKAKRKK